MSFRRRSPLLHFLFYHLLAGLWHRRRACHRPIDDLDRASRLLVIAGETDLGTPRVIFEFSVLLLRAFHLAAQSGITGKVSCSTDSTRSTGPVCRDIFVTFLRSYILPSIVGFGASCAAAAGPTEACSAERWERRLGGLLEGEGGGKQGCLQCRNRAAGCGGHDDAPGGRLRAPCGRPAAAAPPSLTLRGESEWGQICHHCLMNIRTMS